MCNHKVRLLLGDLVANLVIKAYFPNVNQSIASIGFCCRHPTSQINYWSGNLIANFKLTFLIIGRHNVSLIISTHLINGDLPAAQRLFHNGSLSTIDVIRNRFYWHGLTLILVCIGNCTPRKVWDEIIYAFPNFNGCTVDVWKWIGNFILRF